MQIEIESKLKNYTLSFTEDTDFDKELARYNPSIIIVDRNVYDVYKNDFKYCFSKSEIILFDAVEENKTIDKVLSMCDKVMSFSAKKNMTIISFGGGITQDVSGFLSSILYRGVHWIFVPTTLLAQADSCMGSKTSLNYGHYKNLLGTFYPPSKIFIHVEFVKTLSERDFYSGVGEIVKLHLMGGEQTANSMIEKIKLLNFDKRGNTLRNIIKKSLEIKYTYIKDDEFDTGKRNLLNYGHCFGHALESSSDYLIPHGIAIVIGILFANGIAVKRNLMHSALANRLKNELLLPCIKCKLEKAFFDKEKIVSAMKMDKKRVGDGLPLIVLDDMYALHKLIDLTPEEVYCETDELMTYLKLD